MGNDKDLLDDGLNKSVAVTVGNKSENVFSKNAVDYELFFIAHDAVRRLTLDVEVFCLHHIIQFTM